MTTTVIYGDTSDGMLQSSGTADWNQARAGTASLSANTAGNYLSNDGSASGSGIGHVFISGIVAAIQEAFLAFDISALNGEEVTDASLVLYQYSAPASPLPVEARAYDWGSTLTAGDWVPGASLGSLTLLATRSAGSGANNSLVTFSPSSTNLVNHLNDVLDNGQVSRMVLHDQETRVGTNPGNPGFVIFVAANASGTSQDPRLVIEHETAITSIFERFNGSTWETLPIERFNGTTWETLTLERVT